MTSSRIILRVLAGPLSGREYVFDSHDTFLFGRDSDCQASVPGDRYVSRHHFALEINPPTVYLRDLGSLNGTDVNGVSTSENPSRPATPSERRKTTPYFVLKHGDVITVGATRIRVEVEQEVHCRLCRTLLSGAASKKPTALCDSCERGTEPTGLWTVAVQPMRCVKCQKDVASESGAQASSDYVCRKCRDKLLRSGRDLRALVQKQSHRAEPTKGKRQLAGYVLDKVLGRGGMGVVYSAYAQHDPTETVAVKVILSDPATDEKVAQRVLREIGIGLELHHPRIVRVLAHGSIGNLFYVVMELCAAGSLERLLKKYGGRIPVDKAVRMMAMCLEGVEHAHRRNIVHRDLKPANILLQQRGDGKLHPKISDFGLAKTLALAGLSGMTATGTFGGSWYYMPREQLTNFKFVGPVSDVWSLGATFYQILTGKYPRDFPPKKDPIQVVLQHEPVPVRDRDSSIPRPLAEVIDRSLATDPEQRYPDAGAMRKAISAVC